MKKILLAVLFVFVLAACARGSVNVSPTSTPFDTPTPTSTTAAFPDEKTAWAFLVLGSDFREGDPQRQNGKTDSMTLVIVNEPQKVTIVPVPRDLVLNGELANNLYHVGGFELLRDTFHSEFGVELDAILYADMQAFDDFVDHIGGVKLTVPVAVDDYCGDWHLIFSAGQTEVFPGYELLCLARVRKGYEDGFFSRQLVHAAILQATYNELLDRVIHDPVLLAEAALANPFIKVWPNVEIARLGALVIRSTLTELQVMVVNLAPPYVSATTIVGPLADGTYGDIHAHKAEVDLADWLRSNVLE